MFTPMRVAAVGRLQILKVCGRQVWQAKCGAAWRRSRCMRVANAARNAANSPVPVHWGKGKAGTAGRRRSLSAEVLRAHVVYVVMF